MMFKFWKLVIVRVLKVLNAKVGLRENSRRIAKTGMMKHRNARGTSKVPFPTSKPHASTSELLVSNSELTARSKKIQIWSSELFACMFLVDVTTSEVLSRS